MGNGKAYSQNTKSSHSNEDKHKPVSISSLIVQCVLVSKGRCLLRKAGAFFEMENVNSFFLNDYNYEIKEFLGKDMGIGLTVLY